MITLKRINGEYILHINGEKVECFGLRDALVVSFYYNIARNTRLEGKK